VEKLGTELSDLEAVIPADKLKTLVEKLHVDDEKAFPS